MSKQDKITMPSSMGGLIRYFDDYRSKIDISPGLVVVACIAVIVLILILQAYGSTLIPAA